MQDMKPGLLLIGEATPRMIERMRAAFTLHIWEEIADQAAFLAGPGQEIAYIATNGHDGVKPEIMSAMPALKVIACYGVGYDAIDANAAAARGVIVTHTPNVLNDDVANTAIMLMLACYRSLVRDDAYVRAGRWAAEGNAPLTRSPERRTVGILGLGRIGLRIAEKLAAFDATILYHARSEKNAPYRYCADLVQMATEADVLICITPGGAETAKLVDREVMDALGPDGVLINVARGSVVDETELVAALKEGRLGYAGLDVFEAEPNVPEALFAMDNVTLLPHVGSATEETRQAMGDLVVDNLIAHKERGDTISPVPECKSL